MEKKNQNITCDEGARETDRVKKQEVPCMVGGGFWWVRRKSRICDEGTREQAKNKRFLSSLVGGGRIGNVFLWINWVQTHLGSVIDWRDWSGGNVQLRTMVGLWGSLLSGVQRVEAKRVNEKGRDRGIQDAKGMRMRGKAHEPVEYLLQNKVTE